MLGYARIGWMDSERCRMYGISTLALSGSSGEHNWWRLDVVHQFLFTCCDGYPLFFRASAMCLLSLSLSGTRANSVCLGHQCPCHSNSVCHRAVGSEVQVLVSVGLLPVH